MKHWKLALGAVAALVAVAMLFAPATQAGILGSSHDFSGAAWNTNGQICQPCHTPHNANGGHAVLWNHASGPQVYTMYSSFAYNGDDFAAVDGHSDTCMSCHDGAVNIDAFGGVAGGTAFPAGNALLDTDLSNDHPVEFNYNSVAAVDAEIRDASLLTAQGLGNISIGFSGGMGCGTCHDVHNTYGLSKLLKDNVAGSQICLVCHIK